MNGTGVLKKYNGDIIEGTYKNGIFTEGKWKTKNYEGEIKNHYKEGNGVYVDFNGDKYDG